MVDGIILYPDVRPIAWCTKTVAASHASQCTYCSTLCSDVRPIAWSTKNGRSCSCIAVHTLQHIVSERKTDRLVHKKTVAASHASQCTYYSTLCSDVRPIAWSTKNGRSFAYIAVHILQHNVSGRKTDRLVHKKRSQLLMHRSARTAASHTICIDSSGLRLEEC
ncbi:hypothetical protein PoB_003812100 [Plakobranchus ocellatus]|uniref:Uncharacterized protein n=1 Tax=Plakobranchus ocellatus TaxID=259542 RepID=A0AAV4AU21_9GAST|nr:hypothetical protein PoB_003812100 [Plakobranchus ocellatus]